MMKMKKKLLFVTGVFIFSLFLLNHRIFENEIKNASAITIKEEAPLVLQTSVNDQDSKFRKTRVLKLKALCQVEGKVKIQWQKKDLAAFYEVYRSYKKDGNYKKIATTNKNYLKDKKAKKRKWVYYKVKAISKGEDKYESKFSKILSLYVKPKNPKIVVMGECYVEGLALLSSSFPKGTAFVSKVGISSWGLISDASFLYQNKKITAAERAAKYKPDRVYLFEGMNEAYGAAVDNTTANFGEVLRILKAANPQVELVVVALPPFSPNSSLNVPSLSKRKEYYKGYKAFCKKNDNAYYCDITDGLANAKGYLSGKYDAGDGCHWNYNANVLVISKLKEWSKDKLASW